jgi:transposase InsO family protein
MCAALDVSTSGYYAWRDRRASPRSHANDQLLSQIREVHQRSRCTYGSPRITQELRAQGYRVGENRVAELMRTAQIRARSACKWEATTQSARRVPVAENTPSRAFNVAQPNCARVADISYMWTTQGWLYLTVVLDLYSSAVNGWAMSERLTVDLAMQALMMAVWPRKPHGGLAHHSDRGIQYAARDSQRLLATHGIDCSMSRKGNCWDNEMVESFFHTLKVELVHHRRYPTRDEARQDIFEWMEVFYNRQRHHPTLGYRSPVEFESMSKAA